MWSIKKGAPNIAQDLTHPHEGMPWVGIIFQGPFIKLPSKISIYPSSIFIYHLRCWEVWPTAMRGEFCTGISNHRTFLSMSGENWRWTETSFKLSNNLCHQKVLIIRKSNHLNWTACRLWSCPSKVSANEDIQQRGEFQNILRWHFSWVF